MRMRCIGSAFRCLVLVAASACGEHKPTSGVDRSDFPTCKPVAQESGARNDMETFLRKSLPEVPGRKVIVKVEGEPSGKRAVAGRAEADSLVAELYHAHVVKKGRWFIPMDYKQFRNDCEDRAEVGVGFLVGAHPDLEVGKIFVSGKLSLFNEITWGYHVAPLIVERISNEVSGAWVLDPAMDSQRALSISEWIETASSTSPADTELTVHVASPRSWNFVYGDANSPAHAAPPTEPARFCADVETARGNLEQFARRSPSRVTILTHVKVGDLDPRGFVTLQGVHNKYGPFAVRIDVMRALEEFKKSGQYVNTRRQRLYTDSRFGNFWRYMSGGLETLYEVSADGEAGSESEHKGSAAAPYATVKAPK